MWLRPVLWNILLRKSVEPVFSYHVAFTFVQVDRYEFNDLFEHLLHFPHRNWLIVREKDGFPG